MIYIYIVGQKSIRPLCFSLLQKLYLNNPFRKMNSCETDVS